MSDSGIPAERGFAARSHFLLGRLVLGQALAVTITAAPAFVAIWAAAWRPPLFLLLLFDAAAAAAISRYAMRMTLPWQAAQALLPLAAGAVSLLDLPGWIWLAAFVLLALLYWNSPGGRVPLYLTNRATVAALLSLLPARGGFRFADLGSGLGGPVLALARARPDGDFVGFESAPLPYLVAKLRVALANLPNARIRFGDYRKRDLSGFDIVYCYLSPAPMPDVHAKAAHEMPPGSLLISNSFAVPGIPADHTVAAADGGSSQLHLWRISRQP